MTDDAITIQLFGPTTVVCGGEPVPPIMGQEALLLIRLALEPGDGWVNRPCLIEALWDGEPPEKKLRTRAEQSGLLSSADPSETEPPEPAQQLARLSTVLHRLRARLKKHAPMLIQDGRDGLLRLKLDGGGTDLDAARTGLGQAREHIAQEEWKPAYEAARRVAEITALEFASGHEEKWIVAEREDARKMRIDVLCHQAEAGLRLGSSSRHDGRSIRHGARDAARRLVRLQPLHVEGVCSLMSLELLCGEPAAARDARAQFIARAPGSDPQVEACFEGLFDSDDASHAAAAEHRDSESRAAAPFARSRRDWRTRRRWLVAGALVLGVVVVGLIAARPFGTDAGDALRATAGERTALEVLATERARKQQNARRARAALDHFVKGRFGALAAECDDDLEFVQGFGDVTSTRYTGRKASIARMRSISAAFNWIDYAVDEPTQNELGTVLTYRITWTGRQTRPVPPPSAAGVTSGPPAPRWHTPNDRPGPVRLIAQIEVTFRGAKISRIAHNLYRDTPGIG